MLKSFSKYSSIPAPLHLWKPSVTHLKCRPAWGCMYAELRSASAFYMPTCKTYLDQGELMLNQSESVLLHDETWKIMNICLGYLCKISQKRLYGWRGDTHPRLVHHILKPFVHIHPRYSFHPLFICDLLFWFRFPSEFHH